MATPRTTFIDGIGVGIFWTIGLALIVVSTLQAELADRVWIGIISLAFFILGTSIAIGVTRDIYEHTEDCSKN